MAKVKKTSNHQDSQLTIDLFGPGMTALHRVGLAGLWMTLKKFEKDRIKLTGGSWELTNRSVTLRWDEKPRSFFESLFKQSFKIDKNGLIWFSALGDPLNHLQASVLLHNAMLWSFLQHGKSRGTKAETTLPFEIDELMALTPKFKPLVWYKHQRAIDDLIDDRGHICSTIPVKGALFPGGGDRHFALGNRTLLEEPPGRFVALLYASVGGIYFQVRRVGEGVRPSFALVIPNISDLKNYYEARITFLTQGVKDLLAGGTADAGWRVLATVETKGMLNYLDSTACRVISFGIVPWSNQQKTRVDLFTVRMDKEAKLRIFNLCRQVLAPRLVKPEGRNPFWNVPQTPELIARNLVEGCPWYAGFADFIADKDRRDQVFRYEKGGLTKMVQEQEALPEGPERTFVLACQEAVRRHMGRKFARPGGADWGTEFDKIRVAIARCKNAATFREAVTDLWARGGPLHKGDGSLLKTASTWWQEVLPLLDEKNWRKGKDLALLALASYPGSKEEGG